ncbi:hypothetical protein [Thioalkalivibrio sp. ALE23]|uniref:hypothetical protein n=1 Tax=Thioalkalivibrio sp. ALE23 TaxID=1265495 RepID=UPI00035D5811|nr:hypothetical protein [Thioalkalivibrio sp. ALE23]
MKPSVKRTLKVDGGAGVSRWDVATVITKMVHHANRSGDEPVAIALPELARSFLENGRERAGHPLSLIELHAENPDFLEEFAARVTENPKVGEFVEVRSSRRRDAYDMESLKEERSPESFVAYTRLRIPNRKVSSGESAEKRENHFRRRAKRIQEANELPSIPMSSSQERGVIYPIPIKPRWIEDIQGVPVSGVINSYGLSGGENRLYLPLP